MKHSIKHAMTHNLGKCLLTAFLLQGISTQTQAQMFTDVPESHWAYSYIEDMASQGFMNGKGEGLFVPSATLSNGEYCTIMANAYYGETLALLREQEAAYWWEPYVKTCALRGALTGTSMEAKYQLQGSWDAPAGEEIIRFDAAQMITNLLDSQGFDPLPDSVVPIILTSITDEVPEYYQTAVASAYYYGFLGGRQDGSFDGFATLSRAEAAVVLSGLVNSGVLQEESAPNYTTVEGVGDVHANVYQVFLLVNQERANEGLPPFTLDLTLCEVAQFKSDEMSEYKYLEHISPITGHFSSLLTARGINASSARENLAAGQRSPEAVVREWMASTDHRKNLLATDIAKIGIGFTLDGYYWSQIFTDANANTNGEVTDESNLQVYGKPTVESETPKGLYSMEMVEFIYDNYFETDYVAENQIIAVPLANIGEQPLTFDSISITGTNAEAFQVITRPSIISVGATAYVELQPVAGLPSGYYECELHVKATNLQTISQVIGFTVQ